MTPTESTQAVVAEAVDLQKAGRIDEAERLYRLAIQACPQHPEANHNLGIISVQRGNVLESVAYFATAFQADDERDLYRRSYARALALSKKTAAADALIREGEAKQWLHEGNQHTGGMRYLEAIDCFARAIALNPRLGEAYLHLGTLLIENGRVAEGFAYLMKRAELGLGPSSTSPGQAEALHKTKHDQEQREYLIHQGFVPEETPQSPIVHFGQGARVLGSALNQSRAAAAIDEWRMSTTQIVVIDDFLTPEALQRVRDYCAESTVWRRVYDAGYIGATPADGFACPLLAQITEEISANYAAILEGHAFCYLGAFKYDSELSTGTNIHADYSAINLNLYIAPNDANLDQTSGGMEIWNLAARDERELRRLNSSDREVRTHLAENRATSTKIAHRSNRAVFFASKLFHKTDTCRFKEGYLNKRINVSFLYGKFG